ncbi:DUF3000 family protein [Gordonia amarae]|uniref:DUF3000 family protein n=1 Tax=Gordonia amarae TaxID=36821 RepID=A0A857KIY8_9ACTN|nr:DUF3000 domain-containing protein [Gordonia amarae]MCS3878818.1 hypothetical protein [Gordonia amarae]QHN17388.1 DUF3000 family protein [Gordonia amarae]QHN21914.1 DUF3000 family protein [Gordonia amarae]QHN30763.1 DUF3000 family protein [Gordonia amarae]QHN39540.1 DUF3000 family protein [Gordonia amarae]
MTSPGAPTESSTRIPEDFRTAVDSLGGAHIRPEIEVGPIRPPQRLAPYSHALGVEVRQFDGPDQLGDDEQGSAFGRLILLHDPAGHEAWNGTMRLVAYVQAEVEAALAMDPLLPEVAWSWLADALGVAEGDTSSTYGDVHVTALGGTVTSTSSVRYGDIAGQPRTHQLELRASWTATDLDLGRHLEAFCEVLSAAAGLPPVGVTEL